MVKKSFKIGLTV